MTPEEIKNKVLELGGSQGWNHYYDFGTVTTMKKIDSPGFNLVKWERVKKVFEKYPIKDKIILDVGCSDGYFSIMASEMAAIVDGIEPDLQRIEKANFAKIFFDKKNVDFSLTDIYDFKTDEKYHMSFALGFLHRVPDIYKVLETLTTVSEMVLLEYKTLDDKRPICLWGGGEKKLNKLNQLYFIPTVSFVEGIMGDFDFKSVYLDNDSKSHLNYKRTIQLFKKSSK